MSTEAIETGVAFVSLDDGQRTPHAEVVTCPFSGKSLQNGSSLDSIQEVDPELLRSSLEDRVTYLKDFLNFNYEDQEIINQVGPLVNDLIPEVVDALYAKLFEFDITKQAIMAISSAL